MTNLNSIPVLFNQEEHTYLNTQTGKMLQGITRMRRNALVRREQRSIHIERKQLVGHGILRGFSNEHSFKQSISEVPRIGVVGAVAKGGPKGSTPNAPVD